MAIICFNASIALACHLFSLNSDGEQIVWDEESLALLQAATHCNPHFCFLLIFHPFRFFHAQSVLFLFYFHTCWDTFFPELKLNNG